MKRVLQVEKLEVELGRRAVLLGVSFEIGLGESAAIIGREGAGKSVLLKTIAGVIHARAGRILVDERPLAEWDLRSYREKVGMTFQRGGLFDSMTVREQVAFALSNVKAGEAAHSDPEAIDAILERVGLADAHAKYPFELSGGMQKRLGLARALIRRPQILLLDDPTAGLDPVTAKQIADLILDMQRDVGYACLIVTHELTVARALCSRALFLDSGKVVIDGTWNELLSRSKSSVKEFLHDARVYAAPEETPR